MCNIWDKHFISLETAYDRLAKEVVIKNKRMREAHHSGWTYSVSFSAVMKSQIMRPFVCTDDKKGEKCIPMDGYFELIYTSTAEINPSNEENAVLGKW